MEGKTGRTKGKENTCRTVGITKALADSGHSTACKGFFYFFALKFGYSTETKNPNASPIRKVFGLFVCVFIVQKGYLTKAPYNPCNLHPKLYKQL